MTLAVTAAGCDGPPTSTQSKVEPYKLGKTKNTHLKVHQREPNDSETKAHSAVFGKADGIELSVGEKTVLFRVEKTFFLQTKNILISTGDTISSAHPDPGYIAIWYLAERLSEYRVKSGFPVFVPGGTFGDGPDWVIRSDLGLNPVLQVDGFGMWFGHAYTCTTIVRLSPAKPEVLIRGLLTQYDFDAGDGSESTEKSEHITGTIRYERSKDRFVVHYGGTTQRELIFVKGKTEYVLIKGRSPKKC